MKRVREKVRRNPGRSIRKLAKENVAFSAMQTIVKKGLGMFPYKKVKIQLLSEATKGQTKRQGKGFSDPSQVRHEWPSSLD